MDRQVPGVGPSTIGLVDVASCWVSWTRTVESGHVQPPRTSVVPGLVRNEHALVPTRSETSPPATIGHPATDSSDEGHPVTRPSTRIVDLLRDGPTTSFEFMPPRSDAGEARLRTALDELAPLQPSFASVTYGAGGSTRDRTHRIVVDLLDTFTPMAHLTTWGHSREQLVDIVASYHEAGVRNILALRGDPPRSEPDLPIGDLPNAIDLVHLVREVAGDDISIGVAAQPQLHPSSPDRRHDREFLAAKLDEADFGITQFFFRADDYLSMVDELAELGCDVPVLPGVMPITNVGQIERFAELSGAPVPTELADRLRAVADDDEAVMEVGVEEATRLCRELLDGGAPGIHYYTLNTSTATRQIHANVTATRRGAAA